MARRRGFPRSSKDLPEWMHGLLGYEWLLETLPDSEIHAGEGDWSVHLELPEELNSITEVADPLVIVSMMTYGIARIEDKLVEVVALARRSGRSWTEIGSALGMTKQAAWERYSGED